MLLNWAVTVRCRRRGTVSPTVLPVSVFPIRVTVAGAPVTGSLLTATPLELPAAANPLIVLPVISTVESPTTCTPFWALVNASAPRPTIFDPDTWPLALSNEMPCSPVFWTVLLRTLRTTSAASAGFESKAVMACPSTVVSPLSNWTLRIVTRSNVAVVTSTRSNPMPTCLPAPSKVRSVTVRFGVAVRMTAVTLSSTPANVVLPVGAGQSPPGRTPE